MKEFEVKPVIYEYGTFQQFADEFQLKPQDLILTNRYIYSPVIEKTGVECTLVFQEEFGTGEPSDTMINSIIAFLKDKPFERIIAVGGGTIIDIAKVLAVLNDEDDVNLLYDKMGSLTANHQLIIIPTTCGTGSEVTNISILNRTKLGTKQGLVADAMFAKYAVIIPEFIKTLPYGVFATSSIDALIHACESYLSPLANPYTRVFSVEAIKDILDGYKKVAEDRNHLANLSMQFLRASNYAGIAFSIAGCGPVHALSYALGGKYHVAHGESNYQYFVPVLKLYEAKKPDGQIVEFKKLLSDVLGCQDGIAGLEELLEKILKRKPMSGYGASEDDLTSFTESTIANQQRLLSKAYVPLTKEDIYSIFANCLY